MSDRTSTPASSRPRVVAFNSFVTNRTSRTSTTISNATTCPNCGCDACTKHLPGGNDRWFNAKWENYIKGRATTPSTHPQNGESSTSINDASRGGSQQSSSSENRISTLEPLDTDLSRQKRLKVVRDIKKFSDVFSPLTQAGMSKIGEGAYGSVRKAIRLVDGKLCAVKSFKKSSYSGGTQRYDMKVQIEFAISKSLNHPNIVEIFGLCEGGMQLHLVMEYCDTDLRELIARDRLYLPSREEDRICFFVQLVKGLQYLHHNGIAHNDIKCNNLLVTARSILKITDFGLSKVFTGEHPAAQWYPSLQLPNPKKISQSARDVACPGHWPPEALDKDTKYDVRGSDVWGAALVMIKMTSNRYFWSSMRMSPENIHYQELVLAWQRFNQIRMTDSRIVPRISFLDKAFESNRMLGKLIISMLNPEPSKRLMIEEIADDAWFQGQKCCVVYENEAVSERPSSIAATHNHIIQHVIPKEPPAPEVKVETKVKGRRARVGAYFHDLKAKFKKWRHRR